MAQKNEPFELTAEEKDALQLATMLYNAGTVGTSLVRALQHKTKSHLANAAVKLYVKSIGANAKPTTDAAEK